MTILREILAHFAVTADATPLERLNGQIEKVKAGLGVLAEAFAVHKLLTWTHDVIDAADGLQDVADRAGISTDSLQAWQFAAKLNGVAAAEMASSFGFLNRTLSEAAQGGTTQAGVFRRLGVQIKDSQGSVRALDALLPDVAQGIADIANPVERAGAAMEIFGRSGAQLLPLLTKGRAGVAELRAEFDALGGGFTQETIDAAGEYNDQMDRLKVILTSLSSRILSTVLPAFQAFADTATSVARGIDYLNTNTDAIEAALAVAGAAVAVFSAQWIGANAAMLAASVKTWVPIVAHIGLASAAITGTVLIVEDLIGLFDGGQSAIGRFVDEIFGLGAAEEVVVSIKQAFDDLFYSAEKALAAVGLADAPTLTPDQHRERRRQNAVASGDLNAYVSEKTAGRTREQAREDFLAQRERYVQEHPQAVTAKDVGSGLAPAVAAPTATAPRIAARAVGASRETRSTQVKVDAPKVDIHLPPGSSREQLDAVRKTVQDVLDQNNRRTLAALESVSP